MKDEDKAKDLLINELVDLRQRITELGASETQQKREKETLKTLSVQWQTTFDAICDAVCLMDTEGRILQGNKAMMQLLGKSSGELIGRTCYELMHGTSKRPEECPVIRMQETRRRENLVLRLDDRWYNVTVDPLLDDDGSINGVVHIISDITERKRTEEEVKKSKQMLEAITQGITESLLLLSKDLKILWANKAALEEYGYELEDIIGKSCYQVTHSQESPCEAPLDPCPIYELQETDTSQTQTHTHADTEGNKKFVEVSAYPVKDEKGQVAQFVYVSKNITEHKRAEEALRKRTHDLVERVKELYCLYGITKLVETPGIVLEEILQGIVELMPPSWQYPESTCARIILADQMFITNNFEETIWKQACDIIVHGNRAGTVEVYYLEEKPDIYEGPFLKEERHLINAIGERVGKIIAHKRAEERYRDLLESITDGVQVLDREWRYVLVNEEVERIAGMPKEKLLGNKVTDLFPGIEESAFYKSYEKVFETGEPATVTAELRFEDGRVGWWEQRAFPTSEGVLSIIKNVTELKQAEEALKESEERLRLMIGTSLDVIFRIELDKGYTFMSPSVEDLMGHRPEDYYNDPEYWRKITHSDDIAIVEDMFAAILKGKEPPKLWELRQFDKDGNLVYLEFTLIAIRDDANKIVALEGVARDITGRVQAEKKLKKYSEQLEEMVEKRTKELEDAQEELVRKEKLAVLGKLAGGVAHELRNPLGSIKNATYFLNMELEESDPEVKEMIEIIEKEVATSEKIINSLLGFARPKPLTRRYVNINEVILEQMSRVNVPENIEVINQLDETLTPLFVDRDQLGQVFGNIILNAIQAMPEGGKLTLKSEAPSPEWATVSFSDTGVGIPEEVMRKIYEPLFTTKAKGIGLGLAITKTLVEAHGGTINVQSEVGKGTTFTIKLFKERTEGQ